MYQIVWLRLAFAAFGIVTPVLSVVISVFMLGLALGSWAGGRYIGTLTVATKLPAIIFYAAAEFLIGVGGMLVVRLFSLGESVLLSAGSFDSLRYMALSAVILGASILPWCICMGATFPFMLLFIKELNLRNKRGFSYLYLANVIGAMAGTVATSVLLIELLGFKRTLLVAALINFGIAATSLFLAFLYLSHKPIYELKADIAESEKPNSPLIPKNNLSPSILFATGFASMAMEVVWTRAFTRILFTTIYSFASILTVYLLATWIGSWLYRRDFHRKRIADTSRLIAHLSYFSLLPLVFSDPRIWRMTCIHEFKISQAIIAVASIFPFCAALGYLTPKLIDDYSRGDPKAAGNIYAINIVGCIMGPLCAGYLLLPLFGVKLSLIMLAMPFAGYLFYYIYTGRKIRAKKFNYAFISGTITVLLLVSCVTILTTDEENASYKPGIVRRDYAATVISCGKGMKKRLLVNGIGMTSLDSITKWMVHIPLVIREKKPESALVICLGMGTSFRSAVSWGIKTTAVELVPSVRDAFSFYFDDADTILKKPGARIVIDDGRRFLRRTPDKYDIIAIDPPPPIETSGSGLLYSEEFYRLLKTRLREGGIMSQWFPGGETAILKAVTRAISAEFPYMRIYRSTEGWGYHFFASMQPFDMPKGRDFAARLPKDAIIDLVEWEQDKKPIEIYDRVLGNEVSLREILTADAAPSITDDRPYNEYFLLRRLSVSLHKEDNRDKDNRKEPSS